MKTLDQITAADRERIGGKAYNCARLKQAGFPVPDGVVVTADASDQEIGQLVRHPWFERIATETRFAVRSSGLAEDSADHSFAGVHDTELNVDRDRLVDAVKRCRRSADAAPSRAYRAARNLNDEETRIAVLVQCMVPALRSGVAFTVNPVTGADEIIVNSIEGLGEALVSGQVTPDEQRLSKTDRSDLAQLLVGIERHYGVAQDIEWCFDGQRYWIVQSRPVTTSVRPGAKPSPLTTGDRPEIEWTRANLAEVFPDQLAPQVLDVYVDLLNTGERRFFGRLMAPEEELGPVIKAFHGRLYFNLSQLRHVVACVGVPFAGTLRSLGHAEQIHPGDEVARWPPLMRLLRVLPDIVRLARYDLGMARVFREHQARTERALTRLTSRDPGALSDQDIWAAIAWWVDSALPAIPPVFVMSNVQTREDIIRKACERVGTAYDALAYPHLAAGPRSVSSQQAFDLIRLAAIVRDEPRAAAYLHRDGVGFADLRVALAGTTFLAEFDAFMNRYGHRGRYESDWSIPRLHEDPTPVLFAIRAQMDAPQDVDGMIARQASEAAAAWRAFEARLTAWQRWTLLPRVRTALRQLKQQYIWREQVRSDLTRVLAALRPWHLALARRFVERGWLDRVDDYFLLLLREVRQACDDPAQGWALRAIAARRAVEREAERPLQLPLFMRESELSALMAQRPLAVGAADELRGFCVSPGCVTAEVVVMRDPDEFATMKRGAILVAPATDPSWTPLFTLAAGVIVEVGGMLSHASTIAREYGLPALANVKNATRILKTGDRVVLDASGGVVRRRAPPATRET